MVTPEVMSAILSNPDRLIDTSFQTWKPDNKISDNASEKRNGTDDNDDDNESKRKKMN